MPTFEIPRATGRKTILSSPTRGNPYGRTGAPGAATAPQKPQGGTMTNADAYRAVGQPQYAGRSAVAPAPAPQQNIAQLQARAAQGAPARTAAPAAYQATGGQLQQRPMTGLGAILGSGNQIGGAPNAAAQQQMANQGAAQARAAGVPGAAQPDPRLAGLYARYGIR